MAGKHQPENSPILTCCMQLFCSFLKNVLGIARRTYGHKGAFRKAKEMKLHGFWMSLCTQGERKISREGAGCRYEE